MLAPTFAAVVGQRMWRADWRAPFRYSDDVILHLMFVRGVLDHGWGYTNSQLGAPLGQQLYDFPVFSGDDLNVLLIKSLGLGSSSAALVMNVFYLLTFPLVGLTCFLVLRWLRVSAPVAVVIATLYSLLPYHFLRNETHLLLSAYYAVPLGAFLVLSLLLGRPLFARRAGVERWRGWLSTRTLLTLGLCVVVAGASGSFYYSGFTVLLASLAAVLGAVTHRRWSILLSGGAIVASILALTIVSLSPTIAYHLGHGQNPADVGHRHGFESEYYSLRMTQLLLPLEGHRLGAFSHVRETYDTWTQSTGIADTEARLATLGTFGALGFVGLLAVVLVAAIAGRVRPSPLARAAGIAVLLSFLTATIGGFSSLIGLVFPDLRAWDRLSIFIAFFSLLGVGLLLDWLRLRPVMRPPVFAVLLVAVLVLGYLDQVYPGFTPQYDQVAAQWNNDQQFGQAIEARLPSGAAVFELPYADFPEGETPGGTGSYDAMRPYIHSRSLRWSFGAMHGRPADWAALLSNAPLTRTLPAVSAVGFDGIYVDRLGYQDNGNRVLGELRSMLLMQPLESEDKRYAFFDLRPYDARRKASHSPAEINRLRADTLALANHWRPTNATR